MTNRLITAGLVPNPTLVPGAPLVPASPVYASGPINPHAIAMACGPAGAYVDVSSYVEFGQGVQYRYGRSTQFDDAAPGTFTFTLNNSDGRFTPDNPASPLPTRVTEGMGVCWQLGTRLVHGQILGVEIPADEASAFHLNVTCDDMLGTAARHMLTNLPDALLAQDGGNLLWRLDESSGSYSAAEANADGLGPFTVTNSNLSTSMANPVTFGVTQTPGLPGTAVTVSAPAGETNWFGTKFGNTSLVSRVTSEAVAAGAHGLYQSWNLWVYPGSTINLAVTPFFSTFPGGSYSMQIQATPTTYAIKLGLGNRLVYTMTGPEQQTPHYLSLLYRLTWQPSASYWALTGYLYVDGHYKGYTFWWDDRVGYHVPATANSIAPVVVNVSVTTPAGAPAPLTGTVQRIAHTNGLTIGLEQNALYNTLDQRRAVLDYVASDISSATYNGPLSSAPIGYPAIDDRSILDVYNEIVRTEGGSSLFCLTTGTLLKPVEQIQLRAKDRPVTPKAAFDVTQDGSGRPVFVRDITNVANTLEVLGPNNTVTVTDPTINGRYITHGRSETVLYAADEDLREWGQDRLTRGRNISINANTFTIDAVTTAGNGGVDRSADLLSLVPGDRIQLTGIPQASFGFSTWDGWILGASETHTVDSNRFAFTLAPVLPTPSVYDTDLFAAGGDITLQYTIGATDGVLSVVAGTYNVMSTEVPYTILIDQEQLTVTVVTGSTNTLNVARGANGTTPAPHTMGAPIEVIGAGTYVY